MKASTRIAHIIVATDPVILPITNFIGDVALAVAAFGIEVASETSKLRYEKAMLHAMETAKAAGVPPATIIKITNPADLYEEAERWRRLGSTVKSAQAQGAEAHQRVTGNQPFVFEEL